MVTWMRHSGHRRTLLAAAVLLLAFGAYAFYMIRPAPETSALWGDPAFTNEGAGTEVRSQRDVPAGQREYASGHYRFSLLHPEDLNVQEFDEGGGAMTVVFGNDAQTHGFQIFIVPYSAEQVDRERFLTDQPSGVMKDPVDVLIDGTRGTIFFGKNSIMGDTREVWFIRDGFLYEVTTYDELDTWLAGVMQSWKWLQQ